MINWEFKDKISYQGNEIEQDPRKFEILVETYLKKIYPLENWKLTKATRDGNRDIESICEFSGTSMWAEVKYTTNTSENIVSTKFDSTLVSSIFEKNLIKIFFVTNTSIGSNLIGRIKKFYYLSNIDKIAFVDGYTLIYWLKKNPDIEAYFFKSPLIINMPTSPKVQLRCLRVLCKNDSYTIEGFLENQSIYPLYLSKNYIFEGEFTAYGFENKSLSLYCNDKIIYEAKVSPEILTFSIDLEYLKEDVDIGKEYFFHLYYFLNNKKIECGNYKIKFSMLGQYYKEQMQCYVDIENSINNHYKNIYNIYGPKNTGKSWILNNLKNDKLKNASAKQKIIYINFCGNDSDIADICRLIFTLYFDYYNLEISTSAIFRYCNEWSSDNSFFNCNDLKKLIEALQEEDYSTIKHILRSKFFSGLDKLFKNQHGFDFEKIYFVDNIHLLHSEYFLILEAILKAFIPLGNSTFILTGRMPIELMNVKNFFIGNLDNTEVLDSINENIPFKIDDLAEILPEKHYLKYPGLLHSFVQSASQYKSKNKIKEYYINNFQKNALDYIKGEFNFNNIILLLICVVKEGIPICLLQDINILDLEELFLKEQVIQKNGYVYPNYEKWNREISQKVLVQEKEIIVLNLKKFMEEDFERKEIYQCSLMLHYSEFYNLYFDDVFSYIKSQFKRNRYSKVIFLCESLLKKSFLYSGDIKALNYLRYYLAFSYMHCDASKDAYKIFRQIASSYYCKSKDALYFDAESQVIDADYWGFQNFKNLPSYINSYRKNWKCCDKEILDLKSRSYLTATNRMMVTYLALDNIKLANKWFRKNIKLAHIYEEREHLGYTYMDYAKGIYHLNLPLALEYLKIADSYFQIPTEQRRHLDCQCEIEYVSVLLGIRNIENLLAAQNNLYEKQYWIQYYKCHLKLAVCYLLKGEYILAQKHLIEAETPAMMKNNERIKYLCSMIGSFLYKEFINYENATLAGTSYQNVINNMRHNYNKNDAVIYYKQCKNSYYNLDPRIW